MALDKRLSRDVSPAAIKRSVLANASQKPLTVYGLTAAVLGGAYALAIEPGLIALGILGLGSTLGVGNWIWEYVIRGGDHANTFIKRYRKELQQRREEALDALLSELESIKDADGIKQIQLFRDKYDTFVDVLDRKLSPGEMTYNRYLSIAEQVFLGGLDNLENAAIALKSIQAIDVKHVEQELLKLSSSNTDAAKQKKQLLQQRLDLREEQLRRVECLMLENEKALTHLDHVSTKIATINTQSGRSRVDLEDAMNELRHLINRADTYSS